MLLVGVAVIEALTLLLRDMEGVVLPVLVCVLDIDIDLVDELVAVTEAVAVSEEVIEALSPGLKLAVLLKLMEALWERDTVLVWLMETVAEGV